MKNGKQFLGRTAEEEKMISDAIIHLGRVRKGEALLNMLILCAAVDHLMQALSKLDRKAHSKQVLEQILADQCYALKFEDEKELGESLEDLNRRTHHQDRLEELQEEGFLGI